MNSFTFFSNRHEGFGNILSNNNYQNLSSLSHH